MQLKHKQSGEIYTVTGGKLLTKEEAAAKDITASFVSLTCGDEEISVIIGYTKEGDITPLSQFELYIEDPEVQNG